MAGFTVRSYRPGDEHAIVDLFNRVFTADDPAFPQRTVATWRHRYLGNPSGHQVLVAEDDDGRLIANYSGFTLPCAVRGQRRSCSQAVDSVVDRAWRASLRKDSVFVTIGREYQRRWGTPGESDPFSEYMYGLPNDQAFRVGTRILKYEPVHCPMPTQVLVFGRDGVERLAVAAGPHTSAADEGWDVLPELERLFVAHLDELPLGLWRDAGYLAWRYRDWPGSSYQLAVARRQGRAVGATLYTLGWQGHPIVPLVDWIGPGGDREAVAALLAHVAARTHDLGGRRLETWVTPPMPLRATLAALGFVEEPSPFNLCIMVFGPELDLPWAKAHWCVTMGDSDIY